MGIVRLVLALSVVLEHVYGLPPLINGLGAVLTFFIISGFYMNLIIHEKYGVADGWRGRFLANRFLRLYPTYLAAVILFSYFAWRTHAMNIFVNPFPELSPARLWLYRLLNISVLGQDIADGLTASPTPLNFDDPANHPISPAWTLASEFLFYLTICCFPVKRLGLRVGLIVAAFIASYFARQFPYASGTEVWRFPWNNASYFMAGALAYYLYRAIRGREWALWGGVFFLAASLALLFAPLFSSTMWDVMAEYASDKIWLFYLWMTLAIPFIFNLTKRNRFDRIIGDLSYPLYITHMIAIFFSGWMFERHHWGQKPPQFVLMAILAVGAYLVIERPIDGLRHRIGQGWGFKKIAEDYLRQAIAHGRALKKIAEDYLRQGIAHGRALKKIAEDNTSENLSDKRISTFAIRTAIVACAVVVSGWILINQLDSIANARISQIREAVRFQPRVFWPKLEADIENAAAQSQDLSPERKAKLAAAIHVLVERWKPLLEQPLADSGQSAAQVQR